MSKPFTLQFSVSAADHGLLLREFLIQNHISRTALTDIKYHGGKILVNGSEETVRYVLQEHDIITIQFPPEEKNDRMQEVQIPLHIVYEDDYILVIEKPSEYHSFQRASGIYIGKCHCILLQSNRP